MKLDGYKLIFVVVGLIGVLLIATPALVDVIHLPGIPDGEQFSELYLLGPDHTATNYPFNIAVGQNYSVYVDVGNQLGSSAYYVLYVKLGNELIHYRIMPLGHRVLFRPCMNIGFPFRIASIGKVS